MKIRSTLSALALSVLAALATAALIMPPLNDARASDVAVRCAGYERLTILLGSTEKVQRFSMRRCVDEVGRR